MSEEANESSEVTDSTPTIEESAPQAESTGAETQEAAPEKLQEEKPAPFHEHPRFKELIDQNRSFKEQSEKYQQELTRLQTQMETLREANRPKSEPVKDKFLADLEKIDPAYAKYMQTVQEQASKSIALEQRLAQFEQAQFAEKATNFFNKLLDDTKITDPMDRKIMERAVKAEVYERESRGNKLTLQDLEKITKEFHAEYKTNMEARERAITAKYVQTKAQDKAPKGATGGAATAPTAKKLKAGDFSGQAKWLADQIRSMKKEH